MTQPDPAVLHALAQQVARTAGTIAGSPWADQLFAYRRSVSIDPEPRLCGACRALIFAEDPRRLYCNSRCRSVAHNQKARSHAHTTTRPVRRASPDRPRFTKPTNAARAEASAAQRTAAAG